MPFRKQIFYPKQKADELTEERASVGSEVEQTSEKFVFVHPQRDDLEQLVDIERMFFHESILISPEKRQEQLAYNPEAIHALKHTRTNTVVGGMSFSPLKPDADASGTKSSGGRPTTGRPPPLVMIVELDFPPPLAAVSGIPPLQQRAHLASW